MLIYLRYYTKYKYSLYEHNSTSAIVCKSIIIIIRFVQNFYVKNVTKAAFSDICESAIRLRSFGRRIDTVRSGGDCFQHRRYTASTFFVSTFLQLYPFKFVILFFLYSIVEDFFYIFFSL